MNNGICDMKYFDNEHEYNIYIKYKRLEIEKTILCPICSKLIVEITKESIICHNCQTVWINSNRIKGQIDDF